MDLSRMFVEIGKAEIEAKLLAATRCILAELNRAHAFREGVPEVEPPVWTTGPSDHTLDEVSQSLADAGGDRMAALRKLKFHAEWCVVEGRRAFGAQANAAVRAAAEMLVGCNPNESELEKLKDVSIVGQHLRISDSAGHWNVSLRAQQGFGHCGQLFEDDSALYLAWLTLDVCFIAAANVMIVNEASPK